jgi:hypothetical protein
VDILHPYVPGVRPADQAPCWEALSILRRNGGWDVYDVACVGEYDYAVYLGSFLEPCETMVIVEHDMVPTGEQVRELLECNAAFCAFDYHLASGELWSELTDHACLGLTKIEARAWGKVTATPKVPCVPWHDLAYRVSERLGPAHIHAGPADHRHGYD